MSETTFVDTNVLVYYRDASEPTKQARAERWLRHLWRRGTGRLSAQVLSEYYVTVTAKLQPGLSVKAARQDVRDLMSWSPLPIDGGLIERAFDVLDEFGFSWWDSVIVAAAQTAGCGILLTEDLQDGQQLDELIIVNPFEHAVEDVEGV